MAERYLTHTAESTHFYYPDGRPCFTVKKANGQDTDRVTITHARKFGLLPSVTTILRVRSKDELTNWRIEQAILAALTMQRRKDEDDKSFVRRVAEDADSVASTAAELGTLIHGDVESFFMRGAEPPESRPQSRFAIEKIKQYIVGFDNIRCETTFGNKQLGYAGCIDWLMSCPSGDVIADIKTKDDTAKFVKDGEPFMPPYAVADYLMQLIAYGDGIGINPVERWTFVVGRQSGDVVKYVWPTDEVDKYRKLFNLLKEVYFVLKEYDPR